ncbi:MAG: hypothetical protein ACREQA_15330, partial [Candidatus Binatia bacterium]
IISSDLRSIGELLSYSHQPDHVDEVLKEPLVLSSELARAIRAHAQSGLGLALHAVPDLNDRAENLARGQTFICVTDGESFKKRTYNIAGRGRPDRTRMSLNAIELVRRALLEGF